MMLSTYTFTDNDLCELCGYSCMFCILVSAKEFSETDTNFYRQLESSHWLLYVSSCIRLSRQLADALHVEDQHVIMTGES